MASITEEMSRDLDAFFADPANAAETMQIARDVYNNSCDLQIHLWNEMNQDKKTRDGIAAFQSVMSQVVKNHEVGDSSSAGNGMMRKPLPEKGNPKPIHSVEELLAGQVAGNKTRTAGETSGDSAKKAAKKKNKKNKKKRKQKKVEVWSEEEEAEEDRMKNPTMEHAGTSQSSSTGSHQYNTRRVKTNYKIMEDGSNSEWVTRLKWVLFSWSHFINWELFWSHPFLLQLEEQQLLHLLHLCPSGFSTDFSHHLQRLHSRLEVKNFVSDYLEIVFF